MKTRVFILVAGMISACVTSALSGEFDTVLNQPSPGEPLGDILHLAFSPDGRTLFAANDRVVAWNLATKSCIRVSPPMLRQVRVLSTGTQNLGKLAHVLAFSPDGVTVAADHQVTRDPKTQLWEEHGTLLMWNPRALLDDKDVIFPPGGPSPFMFTSVSTVNMLASAVSLFDARTSKRLVPLEKRTFGVLSRNATSFSPDGGALAGAILQRKVGVGNYGVSPKNEGYAITLWNAGTGKVRWTVDELATGVECIAFSHDGSLLASGGGKHWKQGSCSELKIWDVRTGKLKLKLAGHGDLPEGEFVPHQRLSIFPYRYTAGVVELVAFSQDNRLLMSGTYGETKLWDASDGTLVHTVTGGASYCACFSPDGETLAMGCGESKILLIDTATGTVNTKLSELNIPSCHISALRFSPDGSTLVSGDSDGNVRLWDWKRALAVEVAPRDRHHR